MIKKAAFLWGAVIFVGLAGLIFAIFQSSIPESRLRAAPSWTLLDTTGNKHQLEDFQNKPVVLHFWASWCPPCLGEILIGLNSVKVTKISRLLLSRLASIPIGKMH